MTKAAISSDLWRKGQNLRTSGFGMMDKLDYTYSGNQLTKVNDGGLGTYLAGVEQFVDGNASVGVIMTYDPNGNMLTDKNKRHHFQTSSTICSTNRPKLAKEPMIFCIFIQVMAPSFGKRSLTQ